MPEMIAIHSCKTGEVILRERTPEEQAQVEAERANQPVLQKSDVELLKERVAVLEAGR